MNLLIQSNEWSCLPTAVSMVLDVMPKEIYDFLGHDGSEIIQSDEPYPYNHRGFTVEEMAWYCCMHGISMMYLSNDLSFSCIPILMHNDAVLLGQIDDKSHAVAWDRVSILDPVGKRYSISQFLIEGILLFRK